MQFSLADYSLGRLKGDLFGGLTATVVILPLSLAFGVATGLGASAGIYGAIAVGFFAAVFGGTSTQISGPTAPMAVAIAVIVASHADHIGEVFMIVSLAGLFQILLGLSRIGRFIEYTPRVVVSGFMSGIGVIIIIMQLLPLFGSSPVSGGVLDTLPMLFDGMRSINSHALVIGAVALAISVFWPKQFRRFLPAPLLALVVGTLLGIFWFSDVPTVGHVPKGLPYLHVELPTLDFLLEALEPALILALIGSVDSLISSLIADTLTGTNHNPNRELVGQGIGNTVSGLLGGLPGSGSPLGTVANIRAGASSTVSGISYAIVTALILIAISDVIEPIPLAALAGVLIKVGFDVIDWRIVSCMHRIRRDRLVILLLTFGLTVFVDLLAAVAIGLIASAMAHARTIERFEHDNILSAAILDQHLFDEVGIRSDADPFQARTGIISLNGVISIASKTMLIKSAGQEIQDHEIIIFDFSATKHIDQDIVLVIEQFTEVADENEITIIMSGLPESIHNNMKALRVLDLVKSENIVETLLEAKHLAAKKLSEPST